MKPIKHLLMIALIMISMTGSTKPQIAEKLGQLKGSLGQLNVATI